MEQLPKQLFATCLRDKAMAVFGERCDDFYPGCPCCEAWRTVDLLIGEDVPPVGKPKPCTTQ